MAFVSENGEVFGEEYTLVACADYFLKNKPGITVSNLSSSRALKDITESHGCEYFSSAVGEVNVVEKMKEKNAVIGGEGNGGIILPDTAQEKPQQGTVVAVGPGKVSDSGALIEMSVKEGDKILYGKYSGTEVNVAGTDYIIMRESDILAVM